MQNKEFKSLGVVLALSVPSTVEEFDQLAKKTNACLDEAVLNVAYRGSLADFREALIYGLDEAKDEAGNVKRPAIPGVEEQTGIKLKTKLVKRGDKEVEVADESEGEYIARVCAQKGWTEDKSQLQLIANTIAPHILFDPTQAERQPAGPKKLPKQYADQANVIFTNGNQAKWAKTFGLTLTGDEVKDKEALGWKIREDVLKQERERTKQYA